MSAAAILADEDIRRRAATRARALINVGRLLTLDDLPPQAPAPTVDAGQRTSRSRAPLQSVPRATRTTLPKPRSIERAEPASPDLPESVARSSTRALVAGRALIAGMATDIVAMRTSLAARIDTIQADLQRAVDCDDAIAGGIVGVENELAVLRESFRIRIAATELGLQRTVACSDTVAAAVRGFEIELRTYESRLIMIESAVERLYNLVDTLAGGVAKLEGSTTCTA